ncbi:hypothetical protein L6164_005788 [Bauhinia variegata]|uniref:Uncharacterized protein n=1 Tax=Bauhinia variegata TaxID=167791 RepID=A0ACB9PRG9_BAUVA|nr:hypothetical protein L6164_005788 [Bauhinia variegata]
MPLPTASSVATTPLLPPEWDQSQKLLAMYLLYFSVQLETARSAAVAAGQTQTLKRRSRTITITPGKEKSPRLDDNGPGLPPFDGGGRGDGGGGGDMGSGGLILLAILGILDVLKEVESEWRGKNNDGRL